MSYSVGGRTKMLTLRPDEVTVVEVAVARDRNAVNRLEAEARAELDVFVAPGQGRRGGSGS